MGTAAPPKFETQGLSPPKFETQGLSTLHAVGARCAGYNNVRVFSQTVWKGAVGPRACTVLIIDDLWGQTVKRFWL